MIKEILSNVSFFGLFLTTAVYIIAMAIQKKFKTALLNPLLVSSVLIIIFLIVTKVDYAVFLNGKPLPDGTYDGTGALLFQNMLTPTTVCLAVPLYEKLSYLKKYPLAIIGGISIGMLCCISSVAFLSFLFGLDHVQYVTLIPKSITTAMGIGVSDELGGMITVTIASITITGIFGNVAASGILKLFRIKNPVAVGLACGTAAHAMGTSRAREFGEIQEAMSGLSIAVAGIITVIIAPIFAQIKW